MPTITVKNISQELYELLKQTAAANRRSINSKIITQIERGVRGRKLDQEVLLGRVRRLRRSTRHHPITQRAFNLIKRCGLPVITLDRAILNDCPVVAVSVDTFLNAHA